jgi:peptidoglycan/LPS O-acetylase OafA/YrhL
LESGIRDQRNPALDALRGLAVVAVVLFHYTTRFDAIYGYREAPLISFPQGALGVEFFFAISGFVITWTTSRARRGRDFIISRFSRLWPAYAVGIALTWGTVAYFGLPGREIGPLPALLNLTLLQELFGVPHVDGAYWSLYVELIFYAWTTIAISLGLMHRRILLVCIGLLAVIALRATQEMFGLSIPSRALKLGLAEFFPFFAIGILVFDAHAAQRRRWYHIALIMSAIALAGYANHHIAYSVVAALACLLIACAAFAKINCLAIRPFLFLGSISYSLYLVHQNIGYVVIRQALANGWNTEMAICAAILFCVGLATILRTLVEVPAQRAIRHWLFEGTTVLPRQ